MLFRGQLNLETFRMFSVLGSEVFENILVILGSSYDSVVMYAYTPAQAADRNDKGKGKAKASTSEPQFGSGSSKVTFGAQRISYLESMCGR